MEKINIEVKRKNIDWKILTKKESSELEKIVNDIKTEKSGSKNRYLEF